MSIMKACATSDPLARFRRLCRARMVSFAAVVARAADRLGWREGGRLIGAAGVVIVLFIAAFTNLIVRQIDDASRVSNEEHVEQLLKAVTYQLETMLVGINQTMRHADDEINEFDTPLKLLELTAEGRVSTHLLEDLTFIDPRGRIVVSSKRVTRWRCSSTAQTPSTSTAILRIRAPTAGLAGRCAVSEQGRSSFPSLMLCANKAAN
jgi:hypothetical protein